MKRNALINLSLVLAVILFFLADAEALAAKKKENKTQTVKVLNNNGAAKVDGSILNPKHNELNILLNSLLSTLKKGDLANLSVVLTSIYNSTQSFTVPKDAISLQRKKLNTKNRKYLVVNLFNLQNQAGVTISPSALPTDDYKLSIIAMNKKEVSTDSIKYRTPVLIVGNIDSMEIGLVSIEDFEGNKLSEKTVVTNPNGTFFTEVTADNIEKITAARAGNKISTGLIHVVTGIDLYAVTSLNNDPKVNASIFRKPLRINESSTLTANLAKGNQGLALEVAKNQLQDLNAEDTGTTEEPPSDIGCDLNVFADRCKDANPETLTSIGLDFKNFLQTAICNFPEFETIKKTILATPDNALDFVGKGYCENAGRQVDDKRPCEIYSKILADFKAGLSKDLPCPPPNCVEFTNNKEVTSKCINPIGLCQARIDTITNFSLAQVCRKPTCLQALVQGPNSCFQKPTKDFYCAKIGIDIKLTECNDSQFTFGGTKPGYTPVTNSKGNQYCVPSNISITPAEIAEECELVECHKQCEKQFSSNQALSSSRTRPKCAVCSCHLECDRKAGRLIDCDPDSQYFNKQCCVGLDSKGFFREAEIFGDKEPIPQDTTECLCKDNKNNFNEKGIIKPDVKVTCESICPAGYEKDPTSPTCLPICDAGEKRDPDGFCIKIMP